MGNNTTSLKRRRYWGNLFLFIVLASGLVFFFHWHFLPFFAASTLVVGSFGFVALFELVRNLIRKGIPADSVSISSLLARSYVTEYILLLICGLGFLSLIVSSIYMIYEGASRGAEAFEVEVRAAGNPYMPPEKITSWDRVKGRPFIQRPLRQTDIEVAIVKPRGYAPLQREFGPWKPVHVRVPADFAQKRVYALRMYPGAGLYHRLPKEGEVAQFPYGLEIILEDTIYSIGNLRVGAVIVGADSLDLRWLLEDEGDENRRGMLVDHLAAKGVGPDQRDELVRSLDSAVLLQSTREFTPGEAVTMRVQQRDQTIADTTIAAPGAHGIQTFFLTPEGRPDD